MITICPQCQLPLAVTAADLRIAQGQVRCGRCAAVFNALASLYEPGGPATERRVVAPNTGLPGLAPVVAPDVTGVLDARIDSGDAGGSADTGVFAADLTPAAPRPELSSPQPAPEPLQAMDAPRAVAGPPAETTDAFEAVAPGAGSPAPPAPPPQDQPPPDRPPADGTGGHDFSGRDWEIDTMTAAELAALVARADRDEPPELASIQIAIDEGSEITVMPSESPPAPVANEPLAGSEDHGRSLPRLTAASPDDPPSGRATPAGAGRRRALPRREPTLRWLELEPAQPATGSLAASLGLEAEADFGVRTGVGFDSRPAPATPASPATPPDPGTALPDDDRVGPQAGADPLREDRPGAFAAVLDGGPDEARPESAAPDDPALEIAAGGRPRTAPVPRWMWAATFVLGLALAAQLAHLYREELAGVPALQAPLSRVYAALGRPLVPRWEIDRYEVRQQGVVAEPVAAGTLTVRASIRNGASRAQPAPLLRVTLQDRFGNRIASRDLTPREYGGAAAMAPAPMLAPGQRIDAEVSLLDPGGEAVGFELDVCLRRGDAAVTCANDAPAANG